jgi:hypothetical protein
LGLGSSLRIVGHTDDAFGVLERARSEFPDFASLRAFPAFAAFALWSAGGQADALREFVEGVLAANSVTTVAYAEPMRRYAAELSAMNLA